MSTTEQVIAEARINIARRIEVWQQERGRTAGEIVSTLRTIALWATDARTVTATVADRPTYRRLSYLASDVFDADSQEEQPTLWRLCDTGCVTQIDARTWQFSW